MVLVAGNGALEALVLSAAVWRISYMLVWEDGPFDVLERLRELFGVRYSFGEGERIVSAALPLWRTSIAKLFLCVYCMSLWCAFGFAFLYYIQPFLAVALAVPFALSTGAIALNRLCDYG